MSSDHRKYSSESSPGDHVLVAPAKLTTSLRVTGVRDDGYHMIEAEMVSLDLADTVTIRPHAHGVQMRIGGETTLVGSNDLVVRALALVEVQAGAVIDKSIPMGAGLGGGSSDAAAVLRWAGESDPVVAVTLGADVAFCLRGGRALVSGIGEILEPLPYVEQTFTLLTPPLHASTPVVYRKWDDMGGPEGDNGNDLEPAALAAYPKLAEWRDELTAATGLRARLAGSGSTWFVEGAFPGSGRVVTRTVHAF